MPKANTETNRAFLVLYDPRLHTFQSSDFKETIEIPGQYTGSSPPVSPATIVRFDPRVLVMSSIRKPKRISILGSDEKEHLFLVKVRMTRHDVCLCDDIKQEPRYSHHGVALLFEL
jgi:DNA-dependent protein kinase catalytic subunit